jgi:hypothetical protein
MITNTHLGSYGRLGNQLFQYAILLVVGDVNNYEVKIPILDDKIHHGQKCLLNNFNITAKTLTSNDIITSNYKESNLDYDPYVFCVPDNCDLIGYFGSYKYLKNHENLIIKELTPSNYLIEYNQNRLLKIKEQYPDYMIVSLHIRRGDTSLEMFGNNKTSFDTNSSWFSYLSDAKKIFKYKKCKFLIFTGGNHNDHNENDYDWCRNNLNTEEYIYCNDGNNSTIDDFTMMYLSDAHILSPLSTLSWWAGFLNKKNNKITVAPKKWHYLVNEMPNGFYPDNFILV